MILSSRFATCFTLFNADLPFHLVSKASRPRIGQSANLPALTITIAVRSRFSNIRAWTLALALLPSVS